MSLPEKQEIYNSNQNPNSNYPPMPSSVDEYPKSNVGFKGGIYEKPDQNISNNQSPPPNNYGAPMPGPMQPQGPMPPMQPHGPMPPMQPHGPITPIPPHGPMPPMQPQGSMPPMQPHGPMPMATPVYVPPPVPGTIPVGAVPIYPRPYPVPYGAYPYPYPYPYPYGVPHATVLVLPPGYQRDFYGGYSPWGNLAEDLDSLF